MTLGFVFVFLEWFFSWILNFNQTQVKLKKMNLALYMRSSIGFYLKMSFSQSQGLTKMSLILYMCSVFLVVFYVRMHFSQSQNKLKKTWVWLSTCAPAVVFNWRLSFSQIQVRLEKNLFDCAIVVLP